MSQILLQSSTIAYQITRLTITARLCFLLLFIQTVTAYANQNTVIHYQQSNGFPGGYGYSIFEDHLGYIWISTENGLTRFNGFDFKLFTTKDGLPDNEVFGLSEDNYHRLWYAPFAKNIGYIKNEKAYNQQNDVTLSKIHFKNRPDNIAFDRDGNEFIFELGTVYYLKNGEYLKQFFFSAKGDYLEVFPDRADGIQLISDWKIYLFVKDKFQVIQELTPIGAPGQLKFCNRIIIALGVDRGMQFLNKALKSQASFYNKQEELDRINCIVGLSKNIVAINRRDGCFLVDATTTKIVDTLLYGYNVGTILAAKDKSLWLGTHGKGVFRYINTPVTSLSSTKNISIQYIRGQENGMYCVSENGCYIGGEFNKEGLFQEQQRRFINGGKSYQLFSYLGYDIYHNWIATSDFIYRHKLLGYPSDKKILCNYVKDVIEEDSNHLLIANGSFLARLDIRKFEIVDTLRKGRVTSVAKVGSKIYTGSLEGLFGIGKEGQPYHVLPQNNLLNGHILKLGSVGDSILLVANNNANLVVLRNDSILATINEKNGLQCNRISCIKASDQFIWIGTDNGLYAIYNKAPYQIARHLSYVTGLSSDQVSCLDILHGRVWVGTTDGINYFDERDIIHTKLNPKLVINNILDGSQIIDQRDGDIALTGKQLRINFDVIDHDGGQKPLFQYKLDNELNWNSLDNGNLYFPATPFGSFSISIRAISPNWGSNNNYILHFYRPYPFYLRWWFVLLSSLILAMILIGATRFFIQRLRRRDEEKLSIQRSMLQLEQIALQGQMNPHFIFNCIAAIKQYYSSGDREKANTLVDHFSSLIRQTFEMGTETIVTLDKELNYLTRYLAIEQMRFDNSFSFSIVKKLNSPESSIPIPTMLLQPLAENAVRHGVRHLTDRKGEINIVITQEGEEIIVEITDNGVGREKSRKFGRMLQGMNTITSTTINAKRINILNRIFEQQVIQDIIDIIDDQQEVIGTKIRLSYPLSIHKLKPMS